MPFFERVAALDAAIGLVFGGFGMVVAIVLYVRQRHNDGGAS